MAEGYITQVSRTNPQAAPVATPPPKAAPASRSPWSVISGWFCCATAPPQSGQQQAGPSLSQTSRRPGDKLLGPILAADENKKCLVLDLDETLVHSSFKPVPNADFVVPVEIEGHIHHVYVLKRPYVDLFLKKLGELYEIVLFTASLPKYADPVADLLDTNRVFRHRLFREHCVVHEGTYVKDLSRLGRDMKQVIIVDNSPASYAFQPENAVPVESWFEDEDDRELYDLIPFFEEIAKASDISQIRH